MSTFAPFVDFPFFFWRVSREQVFSPFLVLIFALGAKVSKCISESFGPSGYIPCRIDKDGGFIRSDRSLHLPRPKDHVAKAGRCIVTLLHIQQQSNCSFSDKIQSNTIIV